MHVNHTLGVFVTVRLTVKERAIKRVLRSVCGLKEMDAGCLFDGDVENKTLIQRQDGSSASKTRLYDPVHT